MKKTVPIISIFIICFSLISLFSCSRPKDIYSRLNSMMKKNYQRYNIEVSFESEKYELNDRYSIFQTGKRKEITYHYEQLNSFSIVNGQIIVPSSYKTVKEGEVVLENSTIVSQHGDKLDIDFKDISLPGFTFKDSYFTNVSYDSKGFSASVTDIDGFLGKVSDYSSMNVTIKYSNDLLNSIILSCVTPESDKVRINYFITNG